MLNAGKLSAVILATGIAFHAGGPRASAQTSNVVRQWNQTLQAHSWEQGLAFAFAPCR